MILCFIFFQSFSGFSEAYCLKFLLFIDLFLHSFLLFSFLRTFSSNVISFHTLYCHALNTICVLTLTAFHTCFFKEVELIPGGCKIPVTEQNKMKYLDVMAQYRLHTRVSDEIDAFLKGIWILISLLEIKAFLH